MINGAFKIQIESVSQFISRLIPTFKNTHRIQYMCA